MARDVNLGKLSIRCPKCRNSTLEYDDKAVRGLKTEVRCTSCGHCFKAEDGVDPREVERRAAKHVEKEVGKMLKKSGFKVK